MNNQSEEPRISFTIIGLGRVGLNLLRLAKRRGLDISGGWDPDAEARRTAKDIFPSGHFPDNFSELPGRIDTVIVCVPDPAIPELVEQLLPVLEHNPGCLVAFTSGTASSADLSSLSESGAVYGTMHPIQSFHSNYLPAKALEDIGCGIEGNEVFLERASALAVLLGWRPVEIGSDEKLFYHAACVMAGNFLTVLAADAGTLLDRSTSKLNRSTSKLDRSAAKANPTVTLLLPMMRSVLDRLEKETASSSLTGPASRGDAETIGREVRLLQDHFPELAPIYIECTRRATALAKLTEADLKEIENSLQQNDSEPQKTAGKQQVSGNSQSSQKQP